MADEITTTDVVSGCSGPPGPIGPRGLRGIDGKDGVDGINGKDGAKGETGLPGVPGLTGPVGPGGTATFTWMKYANTVNGDNMSDLPDGKTYLGFAYNKLTNVESTNPLDYTWSLIVGAGVPGPPGEDGTSLYTWVKYTNDVVYGPVSDDPTGKIYLGLAYNKTTSVESDLPSAYSWSLIKGEQGVPGLAGPAGANGQPLYTWIKYADDVNGLGMSDLPTGKKYLGIALNKTTPTESLTPTDYKWALIVGAGIPGTPGADGVTLYTWIKYTTNPSNGIVTDDPTGMQYMGIAYNKTTSVESNNLADYSWSLIQGEQGVPGIAGPAGADGAITYTWMKYADDVNGLGLSDLPDGKKYLGIATNKLTPIESVIPSDYKWALIVAEGIPGDPGADGVTLYTWIKYADDSVGGGLSNDPAGKTYMGIAYNKTVQLESTNAADYSWSLIRGSAGTPGTDGKYHEFRFAKNGSIVTPPPIMTGGAAYPADKGEKFPTNYTKTLPVSSVGEYVWQIQAQKNSDETLVTDWDRPVRIQGADGVPGTKGEPAPQLLYRGVYDPLGTYTGLPTRIDVVKYNSVYYTIHTDAGTITGIVPSDTSKWSPFEGVYQSIATDILLAQSSYIENLTVGGLATDISPNKRLVISGTDNNMLFYEKDNNTPLITIDDDAAFDYTTGASLPGISLTKNNQVLNITPTGLFSNGNGVSFLSASSGIATNGTIAGMVTARSTSSNPEIDALRGYTAGVVGIYPSGIAGNSKTFGVMAIGGFQTDTIHVGVVTTTVTRTLGRYDTWISCYNTDATIGINFPAATYANNIEVGRIVMIKRINAAGVNITSPTANIILNGAATASLAITNRGDCYKFLWDGSFWLQF